MKLIVARRKGLNIITRIAPSKKGQAYSRPKHKKELYGEV